MKTPTRILGVRITVSALADSIWEHGQFLKRSFDRSTLTDDPTDSDAFAGVECRLQVHNGNWQLHTGDSSYDQDHRGAWGCGSIPWGCTRKESREIARELLNDCDDSAAQMEQGES